MTGTSRQVHYVDFFICCAVLRYRQQCKPLLDLDLSKLKGKLSLALQLAFPVSQFNKNKLESNSSNHC